MSYIVDDRMREVSRQGTRFPVLTVSEGGVRRVMDFPAGTEMVLDPPRLSGSPLGEVRRFGGRYA
jgi:hypothetical protein